MITLIVAGAWLSSWLLFCQDKGYINRGPDARPLGRIGGWAQSLASWPFAWLHAAPLSLRIGRHMVALPPFVAINSQDRAGAAWPKRSSPRVDAWLGGQVHRGRVAGPQAGDSHE